MRHLSWLLRLLTRRRRPPNQHPYGPATNYGNGRGCYAPGAAPTEQPHKNAELEHRLEERIVAGAARCRQRLIWNQPTQHFGEPMLLTYGQACLYRVPRQRGGRYDADPYQHAEPGPVPDGHTVHHPTPAPVSRPLRRRDWVYGLLCVLILLAAIIYRSMR